MNKTEIIMPIMAIVIVVLLGILVGNEINNHIDNVNQTSYMQGMRDARLMILQEIYNDLSDDGKMTINFPVNETVSYPVVVEVVR